MQSRLIKIYVPKRNPSFFVRSTKDNGKGKFKLKDDKFGKALSGSVSNEELGKAVREVLKNCD